MACVTGISLKSRYIYTMLFTHITGLRLNHEDAKPCNHTKTSHLVILNTHTHTYTKMLECAIMSVSISRFIMSKQTAQSTSVHFTERCAYILNFTYSVCLLINIVHFAPSKRMFAPTLTVAYNVPSKSAYWKTCLNDPLSVQIVEFSCLSARRFLLLLSVADFF